ncbi:hypothetical protein B0H14DRAFT_2898482 [Mycena olivaceomarginata]|nr:hypothetical protein B0H14DRAFT_2898482 [Mycena olivaceomarginata]
MRFSFREIITLPVAWWIAPLSISNLHDSRSCKIIPGDATWPSEAEWSIFNESVDGRLIKTIPIAKSCHDPHYDESQCAYIRAQWHSSTLHTRSSSSMMTTVLCESQLRSFHETGRPCVLGTYVQYAVNVSRPFHIHKTLDFVKKHNIRFVVRNTGHDYMENQPVPTRSQYGTHFLRGTRWIEDFVSPAGVTAEILYDQADKRGYVVVGGECPTVGMAGGYIQGGGPFLAVFRVRTGCRPGPVVRGNNYRGKFLVASPTQNRDLYWALSGGGGGTYGIVWSTNPVTIASVEFTSEKLSSDTFWAGVNAFHASTPSYTAAGGFALSTYTPRFFHLQYLALPNLSSLVTIGSVADYSVAMWHFGGRLLPAPASLWHDPEAFDRMTHIIRDIVEDGGLIFDVAVRPSLEAAGNPDNAVLPHGATTERLFIPMLLWDDYATWPEILQARDKVTWKFGEPLRQLTPDSGAYLNEPDWKTAFYGRNYPRLLVIKDHYDP